MGCQIARHSTRQKYDFSLQEYHKVADEHMDHLLDSLQRIVDDSGGAEDWDVDYNSGVLTLKCGTHGTYVINKQPPNKQIWLSSPTSGPKRYDYYLRDQLSGNAQLSTTSSWDPKGVWFYSRDEKSLHDLLAEELRRILPSLSEDISIF